MVYFWIIVGKIHQGFFLYMYGSCCVASLAPIHYCRGRPAWTASSHLVSLEERRLITLGQASAPFVKNLSHLLQCHFNNNNYTLVLFLLIAPDPPIKGTTIYFARFRLLKKVCCLSILCVDCWYIGKVTSSS